MTMEVVEDGPPLAWLEFPGNAVSPGKSPMSDEPELHELALLDII